MTSRSRTGEGNRGLRRPALGHGLLWLAAGAGLLHARARRWIRTVSWPGAIVLVAYGGANTIVAAAVLGGIVRPAGGYDPAAMVGHALLWDPLFLLWGLALASGLALTRLPEA